MRWPEIFLGILYCNSACWLTAPDWQDQSGDMRAMAEEHHGDGAILRYSPIHIKIVKYRHFSGRNSHMLPHSIVNIIKALGILRTRRRGCRGGLGDVSAAGRGIDCENLIYLQSHLDLDSGRSSWRPNSMTDYLVNKFVDQTLITS